ncbi:tripartite tricarboxylate transporter substrate binding protein [Variovorax paradoxus]|nr:tripartite tricarboxylate transporter substrate binding protein [Variovorax paradoxus]MBT2302502.1 tripartite tricarboxylate transporter substrate binding protein [Variovorax paradoxus]
MTNENSGLRSRARRDFLCLAAAVAAPSVGGAREQSYPARPIKLIVPYPPGGGGDSIARALAERLAEDLQQPIIVDNRPGANGVIGATAVARSPADAYTLLLATDHQMAVNPNLFINMGFDPIRDFAPIGQVARFPFVLTVPTSSPVHDVASLVRHAKERPGQVNNATVGIASQPHLAAEMFAQRAGLSLVHIPYKGMSPAITDLIGGQVQMLFATVSAVEPLIRSGRLKAIAVTGLQRLQLLPDVPTLAESGFYGLEVQAWYGLFAPVASPQGSLDSLAFALRKTVTDRRFVRQMASQGLEARHIDSTSLAALMASDRARWGELVRKMGIKQE